MTDGYSPWSKFNAHRWSYLNARRQRTMLFNSHVFIFLFLLPTLAGFFCMARISQRLAALWLTAASLFFYGWWNPVYLLLLLASIIGNYSASYVIGHARAQQADAAHRRYLLWGAIAANLVLLCYFKYANFFVETMNDLTGSHWTLTEILLPLGISFFTFTQIAFLVDVHRGIAREYNFVYYVLFVTYFPHLIAGPVLHHRQMMPQFACPGTYCANARNIGIGLTIFSIGLFKKVILADQFALYANPVFDTVASGGRAQLFEAWVGALAYTLQLYFDFSGYSDMAIGLSKMFNVNLPLNFDSPYKAGSIIDFWKRWHMTLSAFLRDYLYIPLGGNRRGVRLRYLNLMVTMLLGGLWHGANWTFLLWGGLHGIYLVTNHAWCAVFSGAFQRVRGGRIAGTVLTFTAVVVAWVPFRADSVASTARMYEGLVGANGISLPERFEPLLAGLPTDIFDFGGLAPLSGLPVKDVAMWFAAGLAVIWLLPNTQQWIGSAGSTDGGSRFAALLRWRQDVSHAIFIGFLLAVALLGLARESQFLYFRF